MKKLLLAVLILGAGAIGSAVVHRQADQAQSKQTSLEAARAGTTNELAGLTATLASLRAEVAEKKKRLAQLSSNSKLDPELLQLIETGTGSVATWSRLRDQLGIGWDSSAEYVLVSKRVLKQLSYQRIVSGRLATDTACSVLGISAAEQSGIRTALERVRTAESSQVQRTEPSGDIVAQYTIRPPDSALELSMSNGFSSEITSTLGSERAALFAGDAWRELRRDLAPQGAGPAAYPRRRASFRNHPASSSRRFHARHVICVRIAAGDGVFVRHPHVIGENEVLGGQGLTITPFDIVAQLYGQS